MAMTSYCIEWDGQRVVLPPVGAMDTLVEVSSWDDSEDALAWFCRHSLAGQGKRKRRRAAVEVELIHRADNDYNPNAISVAIPSNFGGDIDERHIGYLRDHYLGRAGMSFLPDLAEFVRRNNGGGPAGVVCTGVISGKDELALDLPDAAVLGRAIDEFLTTHDSDYLPASRPSWDKRSGRFIPRADHRHTDESPETDEALDWVSSFQERHPPVAALSIALVREARGRPRSLRLSDAATRRTLGTVAMGYLFLEDERDRLNMLPLLDEADIPVARPRQVHDGVGEEWSGASVPNMWTYWFVEGLDLRPRDPSTRSSWTTLGYYNPTTRTLWVEDSRLVDPAGVYAARVGLEVAKVGLPRTAWALEQEVPYFKLKDHSLRPQNRETFSMSTC